VADAATETRREPAIRQFEKVAGPVHTLFLLLALSVVAVIGYFSVHRQGAAHQPHRLFFYLTTIAWEWILVAYVYRGLRRRGKSIRNIVGKSWKSASDFLIDVAIAFGFWIVAILVLSLVAHAVGSEGVSQAVRLLAPQGPFESLLWIALAVTAGICEETIFRGYLQRQFVAWTRSAPIGVLLSAALFGAGHIYQGAKSTVVIGVYGLMFGILAEARQNLRPGIITHAWHDAITGLIIRFLPK
jgi:membrane protease YdiL (CAAX protease family)